MDKQQYPPRDEPNRSIQDPGSEVADYGRTGQGLSDEKQDTPGEEKNNQENNVRRGGEDSTIGVP